jgi:predicted ribosomally synthesized peptide with SipW-like signal peptide
MGRHALRITILLGVLITLLGGTGIFAVFSDRATTGVNDVTSGELGHAAELRIANASPQSDPQVSGPFDCGTYTDDLATGLFSFTVQGGNGDWQSACLRNAGTSSLDLSVTAIDLTDIDIACTGDEAAFGDTTCGGDAAGELSPNLDIWFSAFECGGGGALVEFGGRLRLDALSTGSIALGNLAPGADRCFAISVTDVGRDTAAQIAQSDKAEWRFAFDGTVPTP